MNGIPIIENQRTTTDDKGCQVTTDIPEHLCYFQEENTLAIENANSYNSPSPLNHQIGIAYVLKLKFSDGSEATFSSNDLADQRSFYNPNREVGEPRGWQEPSFNDRNWPTPYAIGPSIPGVAPLLDPETHQEIQFVSAAGAFSQSRFAGEKHLYRRYFHLNIRPNPRCAQQDLNVLIRPPRKALSVNRRILPPQPLKVSGGASFGTPAPRPGEGSIGGEKRFTEIPPRIKPTEYKPVVLPTFTFTVAPLVEKTAIPSSTPEPIFTPTPMEVTRPTFIWPPSPTPDTQAAWVPPATWSPVPMPRLVPAPTSIPSLHPTPVLRKQPSLSSAPLRKARRGRPTVTPAPDFGVPSRVEPFESKAPLVPTKLPALVPTPGPSPQPASDGAQTIVFDDQPANIYISYADGTGVYRLEVVDPSSHPIRALFEKHVVGQRDDWVEWDGKDDAGQEMPPGQYTVLYRKDGRELNKLILVKTTGH